MTTTIKWTAGTSRTTNISNASLTAGAKLLGDSIDNETNRDREACAELTFSCASAPGDNKVIELYLVHALDGSTYEDGNGSVDPPTIPVGLFPARNVTGAQRVAIKGLPIKPFKFKPLLKSGLGSDATAVTLTFSTYTEEAQNS